MLLPLWRHAVSASEATRSRWQWTWVGDDSVCKKYGELALVGTWCNGQEHRVLAGIDSTAACAGSGTDEIAEGMSLSVSTVVIGTMPMLTLHTISPFWGWRESMVSVCSKSLHGVQQSKVLAKVISRKGSPLVPALCLPTWTSPQRGEAGGGRCRRLVASAGEVTAHTVPPSNLPPLGGGNGREG